MFALILLVADGVIFLIGLWFLVSGHVQLSETRQVSGKAARVVGLLLTLPLLEAVVAGLIVGFGLSQPSNPRLVEPGTALTISRVTNIVLAVVCLIAAAVLGFQSSTPVPIPVASPEGIAQDHPPFFLAVQPIVWGANRTYRVYVLPDEIVCVWAGSLNDIPMAVGAQFGLLGALLVVASTSRDKTPSRKKELDCKPFEEARIDHKHNFSVALDDIASAEVVAPSFWFRANWSTLPHFGLVRLHTLSHGDIRLAMASPEDVRRGTQLLSSALGEKLDVQIPTATNG